jgi:predicted acetyltransferase
LNGEGPVDTQKVPKAVPYTLSAGPVHLQFETFITPEGHPELAPYYHFFVRDEQESIVGHINLRIGDSRHILLVAGHVGYQIHPEYRGNSYSYFACEALRPFVLEHYSSIIVTADRDNPASNKIIEKLGAKFISEIEIPPDDPAFKEPGHIRKRYEWTLVEETAK